MTIPAEVGQLRVVDQTFWAMFSPVTNQHDRRMPRGTVLLLVSVAGSSAFNVLRADGCLIRILFNSLMAHTYCLHMAGAKLP